MKYFKGITVTIAALLFVLVTQAAAQSTQVGAQSSTGALVNRFHGTWQGDGKTLGMNARLQLKWEPVLGNKFVRLSLRNEMSAAGGKTQVFEGHAYYQRVERGGETRYEARWFDSRGLSFPINAQVDGESLVAQWGSPETEQGKSVYRLIEPGKMEVVDWVKQKDGAWKEFGRSVVVRE